MSEFRLAEWEETIREVLETDGEFRMYPRGSSMLPFLRPGIDSVVLVKPHFPLKKNDLPLYRRDGGQYVLHRVMAVEPDGTYRLCGDNQVTEETGVRDDMVVGVVSRVFRKDREINRNAVSYKLYLFLWRWKFLRRLRLKAASVLRKFSTNNKI